MKTAIGKALAVVCAISVISFSFTACDTREEPEGSIMEAIDQGEITEEVEKGSSSSTAAVNNISRAAAGQASEESIDGVRMSVSGTGNLYVGTDIPAGMYTFTAGVGVVSLQLCQDGELLEAWELSSDEAYEREITGVYLEEGQLLVVKGSDAVSMQVIISEEEAKKQELSKQEVNDQNVDIPKYEDYEAGTYVIGEDIPAGTYRITNPAAAGIAYATAGNPYDGGIDAELYPFGDWKLSRGHITSYSNLRLQKGDVLTVTGGGFRLYEN